MSWDRKAERKERFNKKQNSKSKSKNKKYRRERTKYKEDLKESLSSLPDYGTDYHKYTRKELIKRIDVAVKESNLKRI